MDNAIRETDVVSHLSLMHRPIRVSNLAYAAIVATFQPYGCVSIQMGPDLANHSAVMNAMTGD